MHILLTNDDGIDSPGLAALISQAVLRHHQVTVCAPLRQQSAVGQALTLFRPIPVTPVARPGARAFAVDGTPADCVRLGLGSLAEDPVDLVISGINQGINAGTAVYCSGTVGAAREAALEGVKAVAVSLAWDAGKDSVEKLAAYALRMGERFASYTVPSATVLNINAPAAPWEELRPAVLAPLNHSTYIDIYERRESPRGQIYFWISNESRQDPPDPGSDEDFLQKGHITCTFLLHRGVNTGEYSDFLQGE